MTCELQLPNIHELNLPPLLQLVDFLQNVLDIFLAAPQGQVDAIPPFHLFNFAHKV